MAERKIEIVKKFVLRSKTNDGDHNKTTIAILIGDDGTNAVVIHSRTLFCTLKDKPAKWVRTVTFHGITKYLMERHMSMKLSTFKYIYEQIQEFL